MPVKARGSGNYSYIIVVCVCVCVIITTLFHHKYDMVVEKKQKQAISQKEKST